MATNKQIDEQGEAAKKLYERLESSSKDYNTRRKEQTKALREALTPVWAALADGKTVNGCKDKLSWCKWANPSAKHPERYFYSVMNDKKGLKSLQSKRKKKEPHVVHVTKGTTLAIGSEWFSVFSIRDAVDLKVGNETKTRLTLDVMRLSTHALEGDGPLCKPRHLRKRSFRIDNYPYVAKGDNPTCPLCLEAIGKLKSKAVAA